MSPQLAAFFAAHKAAILAGGAAGVAGLAMLQRKKAAGATGSSSTKPGTIPAAAVVPAGGVQGAYPDTSATDMYNQLEGQLERLQAGQSQAVPVPTPIASTLFAPTGSGQYARLANGTIGEVESDGSFLGLSGPQWAPLAAAGASSVNVDAVPAAMFTTAGNLNSKITGGTAS